MQVWPRHQVLLFTNAKMTVNMFFLVTEFSSHSQVFAKLDTCHGTANLL